MVHINLLRVPWLSRCGQQVSARIESSSFPAPPESLDSQLAEKRYLSTQAVPAESAASVSTGARVILGVGRSRERPSGHYYNFSTMRPAHYTSKGNRSQAQPQVRLYPKQARAGSAWGQHCYFLYVSLLQLFSFLRGRELFSLAYFPGSNRFSLPCIASFFVRYWAG